MGGDQCYPQATREEYKKRLLTARTTGRSRCPNPDRKLFAIPGNHDWYDGLNAFDSLFCAARDSRNSRGNAIGGWQCQQHRSYWAIRLPHNWWIWGADIQFSKYLDTSQVNYFETVARSRWGPQDNLIICLAEPSWLLADLQGEDEEENFFKITTIARARGARVRAVIAGDWHHYARYYAHELDVHFITSGGGGAFLHPTHMLKNSISVRWPERPERARRARRRQRPESGRARALKAQAVRHPPQAQHQGGREASSSRPCRTCRTRWSRCRAAGLSASASAQPLKPQAPKCYPDKSRSYLLSLGNMLFPFYNPAFAIGVGLLYWLITWEFQTLVTPARHLGRQDRRAGHRPPRSGASGLHAALSHPGDDQPRSAWSSMLGGLYAMLLWYVDAVEWPGPAPLPDQVLRRHGAFPGAPDGHVHAVAVRRHAQQLDDATDRARP